MNKGKIVQVMGPVVDVVFEDGQLPNIKDALEVENNGKRCVMEVSQHLGNNIVRCIMLGASEGLQRDREVTATGSGIKVPVGDIKGGEKYEVIYETEVNSQAVDEDADVVTKVETSGSDPDGTPRPVVPEEELPVGGDDVLPANPDPEVTITVTNKTRGDKVDAMVDDVLGYTVDLTNKAPYSVLEDGVITIEIPNGLTLLSDTLTLVTPAGSTIKLTPDVYLSLIHISEPTRRS